MSETLADLYKRGKLGTPIPEKVASRQNGPQVNRHDVIMQLIQGSRQVATRLHLLPFFITQPLHNTRNPTD